MFATHGGQAEQLNAERYCYGYAEANSCFAFCEQPSDERVRVGWYVLPLHWTPFCNPACRRGPHLAAAGITHEKEVRSTPRPLPSSRGGVV